MKVEVNNLTVSEVVHFWVGLSITPKDYIVRFVTWKVPSSIRTWGTIDEVPPTDLIINKLDGTSVLYSSSSVYQAIKKVGLVAENYLQPAHFVLKPAETFLKKSFKAYTNKVKHSGDRDYFNFLHLSYGVLAMLYTQHKLLDSSLIFFTREDYLSTAELKGSKISSLVLESRLLPISITGTDSIEFTAIDIPVHPAVYTDMGFENVRAVYGSDAFYCCSGFFDINDSLVFGFITLYKFDSDEKKALLVKDCLLPFLLTELRKD